MMESEVTERQAKERLRTKWTAPLDKIFADLVVEQIQLGNRPNNIFDKKSWGYIRDEFNKKTALNFNNNQLRKHLDVLRVRYNQVKSALVQNDFIMEDSCSTGFDLWEGIEVNPRPEAVKIKDCPIYEQLCIIFVDSGADGRYAQSSHYEEVEHKSRANNGNHIGLASVRETEAATPEAASSMKSTQVNISSVVKGGKTNLEKKRKHTSEVDQNGEQRREQEILDSMAEAMLDMIGSSKLRTITKTECKEMFSITNCIKALDEIGSMGESLYFAALDLFDDPNIRETFILLNGVDRRLCWLQEQCSSTSCFEALGHISYRD
ncbi:L10-interacting MYB domain-containing protein isoform X1 [Spinacia oleracea]|uniref:L10-interacting MYB domain-containing protein isoform X1 n=2 Tax=Spinacia oleracea TaxID=3562 RepID=A0ABM3RBA3_SPIOL|nr:L10-interacting MYB domain-containing protein-like isoform X1 [Spinacia oleracea]